jgi:hypothetical protein
VSVCSVVDAIRCGSVSLTGEVWVLTVMEVVEVVEAMVDYDSSRITFPQNHFLMCLHSNYYQWQQRSLPPCPKATPPCLK